MQFQFSFKHMETSASLQKYTEEKLRSQIEKFVTKPIEAHVTFSVDNHRHIAHCSLTGGDGFSIEVEHSCEDMYGSVDKLLDKLTVQLKKKKEKLKGHQRPNRSNRYADKNSGNSSEIDYDTVEIDAEDIIKYEKARKRLSSTVSR
ncbi:MAG: ribosome-associated translation inhibitor RaiA [Oligoflexales bacterium]|nr:ribosome-associated translation inhibitor RaiA [Oligoflexales bacterium]